MPRVARTGADAFGGAGDALDAEMLATEMLPVAPTAVASMRNDWHAREKVTETDVSGPNTQSRQINACFQDDVVGSDRTGSAVNLPWSSASAEKIAAPQSGPIVATRSSNPRVELDGAMAGKPPGPTSCAGTLTKPESVGNGAGRRVAAERRGRARRIKVKNH